MKSMKDKVKDYLEISSYLVKEKKAHFYAIGEKEGAIIIGAALNEKPEIFQGVVFTKPLVDSLNSQLDRGEIPSKSDFNKMSSYMPYENIKKQGYPSVLVNSYWQDAFYPYWEGVKWISKLRQENEKEDSIFVLDMNFLGNGESKIDRLKRYYDDIKTYSFILGLEEN